MPYKNLIESTERAKPRIVNYQSNPASAQSFKVGLHPIPQLQRTLGNRNIAKLIQAKRLTPEGKIIGLQRKLTVGASDDQFEQEADRVARQVMNTPDAAVSNSMQRDMSPEEDKDKMLQTKPLAASITPFVQREMVSNEEPEDKEKPVQARFLTGTNREPLQRQPETEEEKKEPIQVKSAGSMSGSFDAGDDIETLVNQSKGRGSPLPDPVRAYMEPRFGVDFSHVRVHTGSDAGHMNRDIGAQAFTHGADIFYGTGHAPTNLELTAHELTHTVQQGAVSSGHLGAKLMIQKADGDKATTAFGEFDAVNYHALKQKSDSKEIGLEMFLKFHPGPNVDAKQIALTQAATGKIGGTSAAAAGPNYGRRSATSGAGQGYFIDRLAGFPNPLYPTGDKPTAGADASKLTSYPTVPSKALTPAQVTTVETSTGVTGRTRDGWGKHGFRYMDGKTPKGPEPAELYDAPQLGTANDSEQIFETTALAIEGTQANTYYGSVQWGWKRDTAGKFSMLPFKRISQGTPSVNFLTAASIWNTATEDFNWGVSVASANILDPTDLSKTKATVTKGTALNWGGARGTAGGVTFNVVIVKDGANKGTAGAIKSTEMAMMDVGRPTVDLPITEVHKTNAAGAWMVSNPAKAAATLVSKLSKDTRVTILPDIIVMAVAAVAGITIDPAWSYIKVVDGPDTNKEGWVKKTLLTREALGTH